MPAKTAASSRLERRKARLDLPVTPKPVFGVKIAPGVTLGYRPNRGGGSWVLRIADGKRGNSLSNVRPICNISPVGA